MRRKGIDSFTSGQNNFLHWINICSLRMINCSDCWARKVFVRYCRYLDQRLFPFPFPWATCKSMIYDPDKWQSDIPSLRSRKASIFSFLETNERDTLPYNAAAAAPPFRFSFLIRFFTFFIFVFVDVLRTSDWDWPAFFCSHLTSADIVD